MREIRGERAALARLIDASANRAAEGLRVADDLARFVLDDGELSGLFKELRHHVRAVVAALPIDPGLLMASRDTPGDVGTGGGFSGVKRTSLSGPAGGDLARAACGRAAEALRSLEEGAKGLGAIEVAAAIEAMRYRLYEGEKHLVLRIGRGGRRQWTLCVLITEGLCGARGWEEVAQLALSGGADCIQLREKSLPDRELLRRARELVAMCRGAGAASIINDRPDIATLAGADGVHLGQSDLRVAEVREIAGFSLLVGVSTANMDHARAAAAAGADYVGLGPMFESGTKPKPELAGVAYLREFLADQRCSRLPHLAISGITPANIGDLAAAGCRGVAVSGVVCGAERPDEVCRALRSALS